MEIDASTLSQLLSSLQDYNPTANRMVESISRSVIPVALIILGVLMYVELADFNRKMQVEQGRISSDIFISVAWKYFVAFALIMLSDQIFDSLIWLSNAAGHLINKVAGGNSNLDTLVPEITGKLKMHEKMIINGLNALAHFFNWAGEILVKILVFLRFIGLLLFKALAPLLVATYVSDEWRPIATGFIKKFVAIVLQALILIVVLKIYPALVANDMFDLVVEGNWLQNLAAMFLCIAKSFVFLLVLVGTQRQAKEWVGG